MDNIDPFILHKAEEIYREHFDIEDSNGWIKVRLKGETSVKKRFKTTKKYNDWKADILVYLITGDSVSDEGGED